MNLNDIMEFDRVVRVLPDGTVESTDIWAPELVDGELGSTRWVLMDGYSGQDRYSGPLMHASEFVGGGMERDILASPGLYVTLVNYLSDGDEPEEWAVARLGEE